MRNICKTILLVGLSIFSWLPAMEHNEQDQNTKKFTLDEAHELFLRINALPTELQTTIFKYVVAHENAQSYIPHSKLYGFIKELPKNYWYAMGCYESKGLNRDVQGNISLNKRKIPFNNDFYHSFDHRALVGYIGPNDNGLIYFANQNLFRFVLDCDKKLAIKKYSSCVAGNCLHHKKDQLLHCDMHNGASNIKIYSLEDDTITLKGSFKIPLSISKIFYDVQGNIIVQDFYTSDIWKISKTRFKHIITDYLLKNDNQESCHLEIQEDTMAKLVSFNDLVLSQEYTTLAKPYTVDKGYLKRNTFISALHFSKKHGHLIMVKLFTRVKFPNHLSASFLCDQSLPGKFVKFIEERVYFCQPRSFPFSLHNSSVYDSRHVFLCLYSEQELIDQKIVLVNKWAQS